MSRATDEKNENVLDCAAASERLPELAGGALDPAVAAAVELHVAGCASCEAELRALRDTLDRLRRLPAGPEKEKDPRFWAEFERGVRQAYDARVRRRGAGARLGRFALVFAAAASLVLAVRLAIPGPSPAAFDAGTAPAVAAPASPALAVDPLGADDTDLDPEEIIDHLGADDLTLVGKALGEGA